MSTYSTGFPGLTTEVRTGDHVQPNYLNPGGDTLIGATGLTASPPSGPGIHGIAGSGGDYSGGFRICTTDCNGVPHWIQEFPICYDFDWDDGEDGGANAPELAYVQLLGCYPYPVEGDPSSLYG